ncbi:metallophosphoesterase family protein [Aquihabitans daechungensis]|uniref:metallophosphoesterase family protein n=1 Tax=Aquihabitans daechungensis TaxID=1052257 RepID=UPI003B9F388E
MIHRRSPAIWVFGVDEHEVQVTWRLLGDDPLRLRVLADDLDAQAEVLEPGASGATLLSGLPAGRLLRIEATSPALGTPVVLAARTLAPLPGEELSRIATVSDLHFGTAVFGQRGTIADPFDHPDPHPVRCARAAFDEALDWGAERFVVKGDLTNMARPTEWRTYARLVNALPVPVDALPGNHDQGPGRVGGHLLPGQAARAFGLSIAQPVSVRDIPGLRIVLVDSTIPGRHGGSLDRVRPDVLDAVAEADRSGGVLIALHHQLQPHRLPEGWPPGIERGESRSFLDAVGAAHPHVLVTSGHTHRNRRWGHAGVVVTQVGSTKDYPGAWGGYVVHEGGIRQIVRRIQHPDAIAWTDHSRIAGFGLWEHAAPGRLDSRCFNVAWAQTT